MSFLNSSLVLKTKYIQTKKLRSKKKQNLMIKMRNSILLVRNKFLTKKRLSKNFNNLNMRMLLNKRPKRNITWDGYLSSSSYNYTYNSNVNTNKRFLLYRLNKTNYNLSTALNKSIFFKKLQHVYNIKRKLSKNYLDRKNFLLTNKDYRAGSLRKKSSYTQNIFLSQNNTCFSFDKFLIKPNLFTGSKDHINSFFSFKNLTNNSLLKLVIFITSMGTKNPLIFLSNNETSIRNSSYSYNFLNLKLFNSTIRYNIIQSNTQSIFYNPLSFDNMKYNHKGRPNLNTSTTFENFKPTEFGISNQKDRFGVNFNLVFSWFLDMPLLSTRLRSTPNSTVAVTELPNYRSDIHSFVTSDTTYSNPFFDLGRITKSREPKSKFILSSAINSTFNSIQTLTFTPESGLLNKQFFMRTLNHINLFKDDLKGYPKMDNPLLKKSIRYTSVLNYKLLWSLSLIVYSVYGSNIFSKVEFPFLTKYGLNQKISNNSKLIPSSVTNLDLCELVELLSSVTFQFSLSPMLRSRFNKESRIRFKTKRPNISGNKKKLILLRKNSPVFSNISQTLITRKISHKLSINMLLFFMRSTIRQYNKEFSSRVWEKKINKLRSFSKITSKFIGKRKKKFSKTKSFDPRSYTAGIQNALKIHNQPYSLRLGVKPSKISELNLLNDSSTLTSVLDVYTRSKGILFLKFISDPTLLRLQTSSFRIKSGDWKLSQVFLSNFFKKDKSLSFLSNLLQTSNLSPNKNFNYKVFKKVSSTTASKLFRTNLTPWYYHTLIRFIEHVSGRKSIFQFYPFVDQAIDTEDVVRYQLWLPRMNFYERRLGHRFFLEESLHIIHLSFILRDPKIICSWLKAMILRISFWKTRSIFRFLKYLFQNYFSYILGDLQVKGLKIRLKGKISAAGNSRKRTVLYRTGQTSHSNISLKVLNERTTVNTFTGVMGLHVYIFY